MAHLHFAGRWVMVTGASSGLGYEMALQLATLHKAHLILVARRADKLEALKQTIAQAAPDSQVKTVTADLSRLEDIDRCVAVALEEDNLYGAILNAGITYFGEHLELDWLQFEQMLQTNVSGMVRMTQQLATYFERNKKEGGLMIVSSMAAVLPTPYQAAYSGTKGFMLNFITALSHELQNKRFSMTVYLPGGMVTEMTDNDKFSPLKRWLMPVAEAARQGLSAFRRRKRTHVPGATNRLGAYLSGIIPKRIIIGGMARTYGKALKG
ncbi:SDR family NAD(P)-dependent oxidoreductase [Taibaiella helva]|uniref:SDR family NAD(P)-dependent oxidoreductase n=1 Tax=Taibaiella helva TaxID=2301235 RepID=UPI0013008C37|nr:SDR family NAD(P)-dependent oxidoreductase [Taibaiella helva]